MLTLQELLIETNPDLSRVATIIVGFDDNGNLVFEYDCFWLEMSFAGSKQDTHCSRLIP